MSDLDETVIVDDRLRVIDERLTDVEADIKEILKTMKATEALITKIIEEVKPTVDELMNSSLFKMLGMKKK
jgi:hypothetical protein